MPDDLAAEDETPYEGNAADVRIPRALTFHQLPLATMATWTLHCLWVCWSLSVVPLETHFCMCRGSDWHHADD